MAIRRLGVNRQKNDPRREWKDRETRNGRNSAGEKEARYARMRLCLKLRQGAEPPETPAPFPWVFIFPNRASL
jgi:hypothetical protein